MYTQMIQDALGLFSGSIVGFSLGLVGGGGSILAVPLLFYLVGVPNAHIAIGLLPSARFGKSQFSLNGNRSNCRSDRHPSRYPRQQLHYAASAWCPAVITEVMHAAAKSASASGLPEPGRGQTFRRTRRQT